MFYKFATAATCTYNINFEWNEMIKYVNQHLDEGETLCFESEASDLLISFGKYMNIDASYTTSETYNGKKTASSTLSLAKPYFFTYDYLHASFTAKKAADLAFVAANVNGCEKVWFTNYLDDQNVFEVDKDDMVLKGTNLFCAVFALPLPLYFENAGNSKNADFYIREQNSSKVLLMPESSKTTSGYVIVEPYDQSKENPKIHIKSDEYEVQEQFQGYLDFPARSSNTSVPWLWIGLFTAAAIVIVGLIIFIVYTMRRNQRGGSYQIVATENKIDTL